jgi:hypothetical protein
VNGTQYLSAGSYPFICTIHPSTMQATLNVIGTGLPRPTVDVAVSSRKLAKVLKKGKLAVKATTTGSPEVKLTAALGKRTIGSGTIPAGGTTGSEADQGSSRRSPGRQGLSRDGGDRLRRPGHREGEAEVGIRRFVRSARAWRPRRPCRRGGGGGSISSPFLLGIRRRATRSPGELVTFTNHDLGHHGSRLHRRRQPLFEAPVLARG